METEGLDFASALESLAERAGVELEAEDEDPKAAKRRDRESRLLALLERTAAYYVRVLWESSEAADAREYLLGRGLTEGALRAVPRRLLAERVGHGAQRLAARRLRQRGDLRHRAGACAAARAGSTTSSAARSCSRWPTAAGGCAASARARCATARGRSTSTRARARSSQGPPAVRRRHRARGGREGRRGRARRGLHRRDRAAPGGLRATRSA